MFDGEMVKEIPFKKILDLDNFLFKTKLDLEHFWSKTKLDLEHFHQNFFLQKALNMFDWRNGENIFPFETKFGLRKFV